MTPSIAVVLPTCNRFGMLKRTLGSLERQTYKNFTVYVSDDASTDETKDHDASSFPNLKIRWIRRKEKFPDIAAHFSALYAEATEDWIALAHDDEIYAPEWLETLITLMNQPSPSEAPIVMAQVGTVVVDLRHSAPRYFRKRDQLPDGLYTADELKSFWLREGKATASNGFLVARKAACVVGAFDIGYGQFDFEWLMRLAGQGLTACSTRLLHTYTMHPENTVGSERYLRLYFDQKHPDVMAMEWVETSSVFSSEEKELYRKTLSAHLGPSHFRTFLKAIATGNRTLCLDILAHAKGIHFLSEQQRKLAGLLCLPGVFGVVALFLRALLAWRARSTHPSLEPIEAREFYAAFPDA